MSDFIKQRLFALRTLHDGKSGGLYNPVSITFGSILHRVYVRAYVPLGTKTEWVSTCTSYLLAHADLIG